MLSWVVPPGAAAAVAPVPERPALVLGAGAIARGQLVAVRRDLVVDGECASSAVVLQGIARIGGRVHGDVIVLGGDALLLDGAQVEGGVHVLGGSIRASAGATIAGAQVAYPTAPHTLLVLLEGPSLGLPATSRAVVGIKLALAAAWLLLSVLLLLTAGRRLTLSAALVTGEPFRCFWSGLAAVLAAVCTIVVLAGLLAPSAGVPLLVLGLLFAMLLKLWGTVAVFQSAGGWLLRAGRRSPRASGRDALPATLFGVAALTLLKLVPALGVWVWTVVTLIGVGAALRSKFGLAEPWVLSPGQ